MVGASKELLIFRGLDGFEEIAQTAQEWARKINKYREAAIGVTFVIAGKKFLKKILT